MHSSRRNILKAMVAIPAMASGLIPISVLAQEGDTLRVASAKAAGDLNPHSYAGLWSIQDMVFEPLIQYGEGGTFGPGLAEKWEVENDNKLIRFHLRKGVKFQDGTPWDAKSMTWNLDRWIRTEGNTWLNIVRVFSEYKVIDDFTVEVVFKDRVLGLLNEWSYVRPVRFLSPTSVGADGKYAKPVGTGPWIEESATKDGSVFTRFDGYWGDKPKFAKLEVKFLPDSRSRLSALRAGDIDLIGGDFLAPIKASEAAVLKDAGLPIVIAQGSTSVTAAFNATRNPALGELKVRQAINVGFDREAIAKVLYKGLVEPAGNLFPESIPHSGKRFPVPTRDVDAARKLLDEAGWTGEGIREKDGKKLEIELVVSEEQLPGSRSLGEIMQAQLGEIGIGMKIRSVDHASRHSDIPARTFDMALFSTLGAPYEPFGSVVGLLLSTYDNGVDGKLVVDPENLDPLVVASQQAPDDQVDASLQAIYDWLHDNVACMPLYYSPSFWAHTERVKGFVRPSTEYDMPYEGISLSV